MLTMCEDDKHPPTYEGNTFYNAKENKCCKTYNIGRYEDCTQIVHTIDRKKMGLKISPEIDSYIFDTNDNYTGTTLVDYSSLNSEFTEIFDPNQKFDPTKKYNLKVYNYFNYGDAIFNYVKIISKGRYAIVLQYYDKKNTKYIAVKYGYIFEYLDADIVAIKAIRKINSCSELVVKHIINVSHCIIMENAIGTLKDLISKISGDTVHPVSKINGDTEHPVSKINEDVLIDILYAVAIAIKCLFDNNLYYLDIKMENILYRDTTDGIQIILGDLGGISSTKNHIQSVTYIPYEFLSHPTSKPEHTISPPVTSWEMNIISWGIGILILDLLQVPHLSINLLVLIQNKAGIKKIINTGNYTEINEHVNEKVVELIKTIDKQKYTDIIIFITNTLCMYNMRWDLSMIIHFLNEKRKIKKQHQHQIKKQHQHLHPDTKQRRA